MNNLLAYVTKMKLLHPEVASEIMDLLYLCESEIEEGGSAEHEIELCMEDIRQLCEEE